MFLINNIIFLFITICNCSVNNTLDNYNFINEENYYTLKNIEFVSITSTTIPILYNYTDFLYNSSKTF